METKQKHRNSEGLIDQGQLFDDLDQYFGDGLSDENLLNGLKSEIFKRHKELTGDFHEMYALVNTQPNIRFMNVHRLLTIVNKPETGEKGLYTTNKKEEAVEDLKKSREVHGDHIGLKKITVQDVDLEELEGEN